MESSKLSQPLTILYGAFVASSFVYVMVAVFLQSTQWKPVYPERELLLFLVFLPVSIGSAGFILAKKRELFAGDAPLRIDGDFRQFVLSRAVTWFALSEVPAILGFLFFILSGSLPGLLVHVGISVAAFTLAKPSTSALERLERRVTK